MARRIWRHRFQYRRRIVAYAVRRLLWTIPIVFLVVSIAFFATRAIGGDPFRHGPLVGLGTPLWAKYNDRKPEAIQSNLERRFALDRPWYRQYGDYFLGLLTFDLGPSLTFRNRTVADIVLTQGPRTLQLMLPVASLCLVPLG